MSQSLLRLGERSFPLGTQPRTQNLHAFLRLKRLSGTGTLLVLRFLQRRFRRLCFRVEILRAFARGLFIRIRKLRGCRRDSPAQRLRVRLLRGEVRALPEKPVARGGNLRFQHGNAVVHLPAALFPLARHLFLPFGLLKLRAHFRHARCQRFLRAGKIAAGQKRLRALRQGVLQRLALALEPPRRFAGARGAGAGLVRSCGGRFQFRLGGRASGERGRMGMRSRAAHRAGFPIPERRGQYARLFIQKRAVHARKDFLLFPFRRALVQVFLRRLPLLPGEFVQRAQIFFQRLQLAVGLCERFRLCQRAFQFRARAGKLRQLFLAIFQIRFPFCQLLRALLCEGAQCFQRRFRRFERVLIGGKLAELGQQRGQRGAFPPPIPGAALRLPRQAQRLFRRGEPGFGIRQFLLRRFKFRAHLLRLEQHRDFRVPCGDFPLQFPHSRLRLRLPFFSRANQFAQERLRFFLRQPAFPRQGKAPGGRRVLFAGGVLQGTPHFCAQPFARAAFLRRRFLQRDLQRLIAARIENLAENGHALLRRRE